VQLPIHLNSTHNLKSLTAQRITNQSFSPASSQSIDNYVVSYKAAPSILPYPAQMLTICQSPTIVGNKRPIDARGALEMRTNKTPPLDSQKEAIERK
jgi:hypothetical protein